MPGYGQFCPVAVASEVIAERWTFAPAGHGVPAS